MLQCPQCLTDFVEPATGSASGKYACTFCMDRLGIIGGAGQLATCDLFGIILVEQGSVPPKGESEWMSRKAIKEEEAAQIFAATWARRIESNDAASVNNMKERRRVQRDDFSKKCQDGSPQVVGRELAEGICLDGPSSPEGDRIARRQEGTPDRDRPQVDIGGGSGGGEKGRSKDGFDSHSRAARSRGASPIVDSKPGRAE